MIRQLIVGASLVALLSTATVPVHGVIETADDSDTLELLAIDLRALSRITEMADEIEEHDGLMRKIVEARIHELRGPRGDESYRWASLQREEASRKSDEVKVSTVATETTLDAATFDAEDGYRVEIEVPRKRSLFSANERIFVSRIVLSRGIDEVVVPASVWIEPGNSWATPLPEILESGEVTVELAVETGGKTGVADVSLIRAKLVDDPSNPYFPAVTKLLTIRDELAGDTDRTALKRHIDEAIATIPGEVEKSLEIERARAFERRRTLESGSLTGTVRPGDATSDVVAILDRMRRDLQGTLQQQESARALLEELIDSLSAPTAEPDIP